jgi:dTDP-4-dehydrorhamnose reductase
MTKILIFGVNGMLGNAIFKYFSTKNKYDVIGISRKTITEFNFLSDKIKVHADVTDYENLIQIFMENKPDIVINCIGIIKQSEISKNVLDTIPINSLFPHKLGFLCKLSNSRLIHFSTDCVFSGIKGNYNEFDNPDPIDLYGRSKLIGEVNEENTITLRTSIIGHELNTNKSLLNWFLSSKNEIKGYKNAFFSGLTTLEVAKTLEKYIFPNPKLSGLYHLASDRISKYELLKIISQEYKHEINIIPDHNYFIDRSLNCDKLKIETGYEITSWTKQIKEMSKFK